MKPVRSVAIGLLFIAFSALGIAPAAAQQSARWSEEKATEWQRQSPWLVGANYSPAYAINQLEMWQAATFDSATIDRELGYAESIGMNCMRVFLHHVAWQADTGDFKKRMNIYLTVANKHHIVTMFVFFDDCWNESYKEGPQPAPKPGIHNSGWIRDPGKLLYDDSSLISVLEQYVEDILTRFKHDKRILLWDLYNEPGNSSYNETSMPLLKKVFEWAWAVRPSQPLTAATWYDNKDFNTFQLANSDIITIHNYNDADNLEKELKEKAKLGRPIVCSEYMARPRNSRFQTHLPIFKKYNVGAINWGLVSGKSNTIYQWSKPIPDGSEPELWFHDIFRKDGTPYDKKETDFIKAITAK